jgi:hypothetical protein
VAIAAGAYSLLTPEKRRHTLKIGVPIGILGRTVPGIVFALKCPIWLSFRRPIYNSRSSLLVFS